MDKATDIKALFHHFYRPLCLYALHYLQDADAAEDVVQESFTSYWQIITDGATDGIGNPKSYLYSIVRNRCIDALRRAGRTGERLRPEDLAGEISDQQAVERSEVEARLWEAVDRLPARRRELLLMSKRDGMTYDQIAAATGLSVNTVRNQISRALHTLQADADRILKFVLMFPLLPLP